MSQWDPLGSWLRTVHSFGNSGHRSLVRLKTISIYSPTLAGSSNEAPEYWSGLPFPTLAGSRQFHVADRALLPLSSLYGVLCWFHVYFSSIYNAVWGEHTFCFASCFVLLIPAVYLVLKWGMCVFCPLFKFDLTFAWSWSGAKSMNLQCPLAQKTCFMYLSNNSMKYTKSGFMYPFYKYKESITGA